MIFPNFKPKLHHEEKSYSNVFLKGKGILYIQKPNNWYIHFKKKNLISSCLGVVERQNLNPTGLTAYKQLLYQHGLAYEQSQVSTWENKETNKNNI